ncbi:MAG TPA: peptidylprolyl isomerase [Anaerolineae bacterium]|nr:peptidylprolyl isomerase [Anaerolineae bacterium]
MAKRKVKKEVPLTRKQISRREKERRQRLILLSVAIAIGCLILGVLGFGAYQELVAKPSAPVAKVNGVPISTQSYQKRLLLERMNIDANIENMRAQRSLYNSETDAFLLSIIDQQIQQLSLQRELLTDEVFLDQLIEEELISQAAQREGLGVSPEEIDRRIKQDFGYSAEEPTPAPSPTTGIITSTSEITPTEASPPMTRARFEELYSDVLSALQEGAGLSEAEYREIVAAGLLRQKMQDSVGQQVPTSEPQIRARHILVDTEEEARTVLERLDDGEDFALLATEVSTDTLSAELGGDLGWFARGRMDPAFEEAAFSLAVGEISDVVETSFGFHIILVEERDEDRELDPQMLDQRKREAFEVWLLDLQAEAETEKYWSPDKVPPE